MGILLDTGSEAGNNIPYCEVEALGLLERIKPSSVPHITGLGEGTAKVNGTLEILDKWDGVQERAAMFHVADKDNKSMNETIMGAESINTFKLLRMRVARAHGHSVNEQKPANTINKSPTGLSLTENSG